MAATAAPREERMAAAAKRRRRRVAKSLPVAIVRWQIITMLALFAAVGGSGLVLVTAAQEMRSLYSAMDELQSKQDRTMAQYSRLLLERGTFASLQTVEVVATQELQMVFPQQVEEISP